MSERLDIDGVVRAIAEAPPDADGVLRWEDDGAEREATCHRVGPNEWHVRLPDPPSGQPSGTARALRLWAARTDEGTWVSWDGRARLVRDATREARRGGPGAGPGRVTPPTPATVVNVLVSVGDEVEAGAPLVVVSAMKMETTLVAPRAGTVRAVNTTVGAKVAPGDELVAIEGRQSTVDG